MTERGRAALHTTPDRLEIGPSAMSWTGDKLVIDVDEWGGLPNVGRLRGQIVVEPEALTSVELPLTEDGAHVWRPFAPVSRIKVDLEGRGQQWSGHGYFDSNFGTRALEADFSYWTWGRFPAKDGATCVYDADRRDGTRLGAAFRFGADGSAATIEAPPRVRFRRSLWAVRRETRADAGFTPKQALNMLDAPFYSRSAVTTRLFGEEVTGVHEALDLNRFRSPLLKPMLAVRVPRRRK
ncbi:Acyclic carotenoid 1,2-hydratase [Roseisalinus antarcticus]|uniref:Acyclic carotenoid 1,2-hydratase n=2 Tax=Roseisalinus antarcticus TaxID=254357 RepID=A0A1Y5S3D9_9RHOB|nr:Acyclic carotenoid 1,2-hydratase [Roseisalinus antarcticus]